ncbi:hypothetical protein VTO42DRAFT_1765 [Malbranchea cinnamomea]
MQRIPKPAAGSRLVKSWPTAPSLFLRVLKQQESSCLLRSSNLGHYPSTLVRLTLEIRSSFISVDQLSGQSLKQLAYLRACIDEALRLCHHLPREVLPGGLRIDEHYIPAGTIVVTVPFAIHHNPEYYPDPFKYRPERWIADDHAGGLSSPETVALVRTAFCPFSIGRRGCIGDDIACLELEIAPSKLLYMYDIRLPADEKAREPSGKGRPDHHNPARRRREEYQTEEYFVSVRDGPMVEFRLRGGV